MEVEGIVTAGTVDDFSINGQRVLTNSATIFEGGVRADFALGIKLEAEGPINANGTIVATKISFRSSIKIEADVTATTVGTLTVLGKVVTINQFTRLDNGLPVTGNHVEVRASLDRDGNLVASRVIVRSASTRAFLQGAITAKDSAAGTITILGIQILTDSQTEFRVSTDSTEQAVNSASFFAQLTPHVAVVKVRWDSFTSTSVAVKQAEIELGK